jgi:hypothetical protein
MLTLMAGVVKNRCLEKPDAAVDALSDNIRS